MKKMILTGALCVALAAGALCAGCSESQTYTSEGSNGEEVTYYNLNSDELKELAGTEIEATVQEGSGDITTVYYSDDTEYDGVFIDVEFDYTTAEGDEYPVWWSFGWDLKDVEDFDDVEEYANSTATFTFADGSEASVTDVEEGDSVTLVIDEEGMLESLVINE